MKLDISNLSNANRRIRLVPKEGATITLPEKVANPTVMLEDTGALVYCLSPKPPVLGISCDGATDRSGKLSFDGPVVFKLEPDGPEIQLESEAELVEWIANNPMYGLTAKDLNKPTYQYILPISTVPGVVDSEQAIYPLMVGVMIFRGKDINGNVYSSKTSFEVFGDSSEYPAQCIRDAIARALFPTAQVDDVVRTQIKVDTTLITEARKLNELIHKDGLVSHFPMAASLSGTVLFKNNQSATEPTDATYDMAMHGISIDLSGVDLEASKESLITYYHDDSGDPSDAERYHSEITSIVLAAPQHYSQGILQPSTAQTLTYSRQPAPNYPSNLNALLTRQTTIIPVGATAEKEYFSQHASSLGILVHGNPMFDSFGQLPIMEDKLHEMVLELTREEALSGWRYYAPVNSTYPYGDVSDEFWLFKLRLPEMNFGEKFTIVPMSSWDDETRKNLNGQLYPMTLVPRHVPGNEARPNCGFSYNNKIMQNITFGEVHLSEDPITQLRGYVRFHQTFDMSEVPADERYIYVAVRGVYTIKCIIT